MTLLRGRACRGPAGYCSAAQLAEYAPWPACGRSPVAGLWCLPPPLTPCMPAGAKDHEVATRAACPTHATCRVVAACPSPCDHSSSPTRRVNEAGSTSCTTYNLCLFVSLGESAGTGCLPVILGPTPTPSAPPPKPSPHVLPLQSIASRSWGHPPPAPAASAP